MAHSLDYRTWVVSRLAFVFVGVCLVGFVADSPLLKEKSAQASCPSCPCDCSPEILFIPLETECGENDSEMNEEIQKDKVALLSEELKLQEMVANDTLEHTKALVVNARRASSRYQKEAEKCNAGIDTCEEARERVEVELAEERKLSELWERRAREVGWKE